MKKPKGIPAAASITGRSFGHSSAHHTACAAADDAYYAALDNELETAALAFNARAAKEQSK